jgi:hypothetical protein
MVVSMKQFVCPECLGNKLNVYYTADSMMVIEDGVPMIDEGTTIIFRGQEYYCAYCHWSTFSKSEVMKNIKEKNNGI